MKECAYIGKLSASWPRDDKDSPDELLALADEAVRAFPGPAKLWVMRGNLIEPGTGETAYALAVALACYERAVLIEPSFVECWEEIVYYYDVVVDDEARAQELFRKAKLLKDANV